MRTHINPNYLFNNYEQDPFIRFIAKIPSTSTWVYEADGTVAYMPYEFQSVLWLLHKLHTKQFHSGAGGDA